MVPRGLGYLENDGVWSHLSGPLLVAPLLLVSAGPDVGGAQLYPLQTTLRSTQTYQESLHWSLLLLETVKDPLSFHVPYLTTILLGTAASPSLL
jgi:hypothetical protein